MGRASISALRLILLVAFAGGLFVELFMVPLTLLNELDRPDGLQLQGIALLCYLALAALIMQVCIVCVWKLATRVRRGTVFTAGSYKFVDLIIAAIAVGSAITFALAVIMAPSEDVPPGVVLLCGGLGVVLAGVSMIVLVLRKLLAQAAATEVQAEELRTELGGVI